MEALFSQFTFLSDQALQDKNFDPSLIEDLMKLFEIEAYNSWTAMEIEHQKEMLDAQIRLQEGELYLDSIMDNATAEFQFFEEEMDGRAKSELETSVETADKEAAVASKKHMEAATNSAMASMEAARKAASSNKVHPS